MTSQEEATGRLVQMYARALMKAPADPGFAHAAERLERHLKDRVDALGFDAERLCEVEPDGVLAKLEELEHEALLEDAGMKPAGGKSRDDGKRRKHGTMATATADRGMPAGRHRCTDRRGRGRQRG